MTKYLGLFAGVLFLVVGCADQRGANEKEAERMYYVAFRDLEEELGTLPQALEAYAQVADKYPQTSWGKKGQDRHAQLLKAQELLEGIEEKKKNEQLSVYEEVCAVAPGYAPAVRSLGTFYYNSTYLASRSAAMTQSDLIVDNVMEVWAKQDSLWSTYTFRPTPEDRKWRDTLCKQATQVGRMLEAVKRYEDALHAIERGLEYASGEDVIAHAEVFASFYTYRSGRFEEGIQLARKALTYKFLEKEDRARAYHVMGLCYSTLYTQNKDLGALDAAIEALNESVGINPGNSEARVLLKSLRTHRQTMSS